MLKSMTGFGKAESVNEKRKVVVEVKTLNSKQGDLIIKIPNVYKEKELEMRNELLSNLQRGKIELYISVEEVVESATVQLNETTILAYYKQLSDIAQRNGIPLPPDILNTIVRMPEVTKNDRQEPDEEEWLLVLDTLRKAVEHANNFRVQEGQALAKDMSNRIKMIESYIKEVEAFEATRLETIKTRLRQNLTEYVGENTIDQNRFEQELIYYLEKIDINEEKVRLRNHCSYFLTTMNGLDNGSGVGKKLGFIAQEMGREINTIGSKANNADMQQVVIRMKDELEKIKEQVLNIL